MKISFEIDPREAKNPYVRALEQTLGTRDVTAEEADLIIATEPRACLKWLKAGKKVRQLMLTHGARAEGLLEAYPDPFGIIEQSDSLVEIIRKLNA